MSVHLLDDWFAHLQRFTLTASAVKEFYLTKAQYSVRKAAICSLKSYKLQGKKNARNVPLGIKQLVNILCTFNSVHIVFTLQNRNMQTFYNLI